MPYTQGHAPPGEDAVPSPPFTLWGNADRRFQNVFSVPQSEGAQLPHTLLPLTNSSPFFPHHLGSTLTGHHHWGLLTQARPPPPLLAQASVSTVPTLAPQLGVKSRFPVRRPSCGQTSLWIQAPLKLHPPQRPLLSKVTSATAGVTSGNKPLGQRYANMTGVLSESPFPGVKKPLRCPQVPSSEELPTSLPLTQPRPVPPKHIYVCLCERVYLIPSLSQGLSLLVTEARSTTFPL